MLSQAGRGRFSSRPVALTQGQRALQQRLLQMVRAGSIPRTVAARQAAAQHMGAGPVLYTLHVRKLLAGEISGITGVLSVFLCCSCPMLLRCLPTLAFLEFQQNDLLDSNEL